MGSKTKSKAAAVLAAALACSAWALPAGGATDDPHHKHNHNHQHAAASTDRGASYSRSEEAFHIPNVQLVNRYGASISLQDTLKRDQPTILNFIFTTCPTICPVMSAGFSSFQELIGDSQTAPVMVSITIDPEHDRPEQLRAYAENFSAGNPWHFFTGSREDINSILKAFGAYSSNKMQHLPYTYLRARPGERWVRLDGLVSARELASEYQRLFE